MADEPLAVTHPELIIGIAGAIGVAVEVISEEIARALEDLGYASHLVRVTSEMMKYPTDVTKDGDDYSELMNFKMSYANKLCEDFEDPSTLMRIAIQTITILREHQLNPEGANGEEPDSVLPKTAYIVRQLKRPSEVRIMRKVYGKQFVLVSAYGSQEQRKLQLIKKIRDSLPISTPDHEISHKADKLMARDLDEGSLDHVQHLRDTFHLADVFVDGINRNRMRLGIERFFQAFFGRVDIGPTKFEYGMYAAKAASLRSIDLSRQVGAAIFSDDGEIVSQGCNEVPKAFGGTYWDGEEPDNRDVRLGYDPNDYVKKEVIRDLLEKLEKADLLSLGRTIPKASEGLVDILLGEGSKCRTKKLFGCLTNSYVNDLTEYGRIVHAEMSAICDAARLGRRVKGSILFVTTFPCHNCTKHILASGISKVIFMEPYPKSKAKELHRDEIELEKSSQSRVAFLPFLGISPFRYRDIFEKRSRKKDGKAVVWYQGVPRPLVEVAGPAYLDIESLEVGKLGGTFQPKLL